jgi:hypothetical protein
MKRRGAEANPGTLPRDGAGRPLRPNRGSTAVRDGGLLSMQQVHGNRFVSQTLEPHLARPSGGHPIPPAARSAAESRLGADLSHARVHTDSKAASETARLGAKAVTVGSNIFFNRDRYQPSTPSGIKLLSHELTHVVQQSKGTGGATGVVNHPELERQADSVAAGRPTRITSLGGIAAQRAPVDEKEDEHKPPEEEKPEKKEDKKDAKPPAKATPQQEVEQSVRRMVATAEPPAGEDPAKKDALRQRVVAALESAEGKSLQSKVKAALEASGNTPVSVTVPALWGHLLKGDRPVDINGLEFGGDVKVDVRITPLAATAGQVSVAFTFHHVASVFEKIGHGLAAAAGWVWSAVKSVGRGIAKVAGWVWTGLKWVASRLWDHVIGTLARIGEWIVMLPTRLGRLMKHLWEGVKQLKPWSLEFWKSLGHISTWGGFLKWLGTVVLDLAEIAGLGEVYQTVMEWAKFNTRSLTETEIATAQKVFGGAIGYGMVRVDTAALLGPSWTHREYTSFHTINGWGPIEPKTLIHELTHVWQYENAGAIYMPQAIHAQSTKENYNYGDVAGLRAARASGKGLLDFNREQQAEIVEDLYVIAAGEWSSTTTGSRVDLPVYAHFVKEVSTRSETDLATLKV